MKLRERIENNLVVFFLATLLAGFLAGIAAYRSVLDIAQLEVVPREMVNRAEQAKTARPRSETPPSEGAKSEPAPTSPVGQEPVAPREDSAAVVSHGIRFEEPECRRTESGRRVQCEVLATSVAGDKFVRLVPDGNVSSRLVDATGLELKGWQAGTPVRQFMAKHSVTLVEGIPLRLVINFFDGERVADRVRLVEFGLEDSETTFTVRFRDVAVAATS